MSDIAHDRPREVAVRDEPTPMVLLQQAIDRGLTTTDLERLAALQERWEERRSAAAFGEALARFQALCPVIKKTRRAEVGKFGYTYASYDDIHFAIRSLLAECGLSVSFDTMTENNAVKVTCHVRHGTYVQSTTFSVPMPQLSTNNTQAFGAALSYGKRYALCAALNIVVSDEDDDAAALVERISDEEAAILRELLRQTGRDEGRFLQWARCERFEDLSRAKYIEACDMLRRRPAKGGAA